MVFGTYGETPLKVDRLQGMGLAFTLLFSLSLIFAALVFLARNLAAGASPSNDMAADLFLLAFVAAGAAFSWYLFKWRVTVWPDRIESSNGFFARSLLRSNVSGYRSLPRGAGIKLIPRDEFAKPVNVSGKLVNDPATAKWFEGIADLGAQDLQAASNALQNDNRLGSTSAEREQQLQNWTRIGRITDVVGLALGAWTLFWPQPYDIPIFASMLAVFAAVGIHFWSWGILTFVKPRYDPRPSVQILFGVPAFAVAYRAISTFNMLDWKPELIWAGAFGLVLGAAILLRDEVIKVKMTPAFLIPVALVGFAYGSIVELNGVFDLSTPHIFPVSIVNMHVSRGKSTSYDLDLGAWGDQPAGHTMSVTYDVYQSAYIGETMCVHLRNGWLGYRYYYIRGCGP